MAVVSFSEKLRVRSLKVSRVARDSSRWQRLLAVVGHLERWRRIVWGWWLSLSLFNLALLPSRELVKRVMHSLVISVRAVGPERRILVVDIKRRRLDLLRRQLLVSDRPDHVLRIIECSEVVFFTISLLLPGERIERVLLQLALVLGQLLSKDLLLNIIVRLDVLVAVFARVIEPRSTLPLLTVYHTLLHWIR